MSKKNKNINKEKKIGSTVVSKKSFWSYKKNRSRVYTLIILLIMLYFFIVNNTREEPKEGPYPPGYNPTQVNSRNSE
ncbi:MAG: hypothetical protein NZM09_04945 [Ignavibacterium sp.]|nr:hypothetical protein [Ignavibacterium sp.]MDW8375022.1 hypothetical protein [Ignavibacteriales bacterium]